MGTQLQDAGLTDGGAPELWNVEHPDVIAGILEGYAKAGAQYLTTNTFGCTTARLALHGLEDRVEELARAGAEVARGVADRYGILVAGDVGPTGELLEPVGFLSIDDAKAIFIEQIRGLVSGGSDFILIETMSALEEVRAAVAAAREVAPEMPVMVTMSFDTNLHTMMGVSPAAAVEAIAELGVRVIGANCGRGPDEIEQIMAGMARAKPDGVHLAAQSNAGLPKLTNGEFRYDGTPEIMAEATRNLRALGVDVIGGCCGTTAEHVEAMAAAARGA